MKTAIRKIQQIFSASVLLGIFIGGLLGYLFYYFTDCCIGEPNAIPSPWLTTAYGMVLVGLLSRKK